MSPGQHSIQPVSSSDLPFVADFVHTSKLALPINRLLFRHWPNDAAQKPLYRNAVASSLTDSAAESVKMVNDESGDIVGYCVLTRRRPVPTAPPPAESAAAPKTPEGMNPDVLAAVSQAAAEIADEIRAVDHYEVTYVCVAPSLQRQGIGSQLVRVGLKRAQDEGVPLAVCSEPAAHDFYAHLGFRDTRHVDIDLAQWAPPLSGFGPFRLSGMIWSPSEPDQMAGP